MYCEEIKHECPVDIRLIIGWDHNAVQHSITKLSMGQVGSRIWTEIQKGKPKGEMLLVAGRYERPVDSRRKQQWCATHNTPKRPPDIIALVPQCLCVVILCVPYAGHCVEDLETPGDPAAAVGRARVHWHLRKNLGEGTAAFLLLFFVYFACDGSCSAQILSGPIYPPAVINSYTLRPLTGLHSDHMDEVLLYMTERMPRSLGCTPRRDY